MSDAEMSAFAEQMAVVKAERVVAAQKVAEDTEIADKVKSVLESFKGPAVEGKKPKLQADLIEKGVEALVREIYALKKKSTEKPTTSKKAGGSKKSAGGKKVSKMSFENDIPGHFRDDKCYAVKMKNVEGETKWTNLTVSQCSGKPLESGFCKKCQKETEEFGGISRFGVCSSECCEIDAEFVKQFDNPDFKAGVSNNHRAFIERIVAQFQ